MDSFMAANPITARLSPSPRPMPKGKWCKTRWNIFARSLWQTRQLDRRARAVQCAMALTALFIQSPPPSLLSAAMSVLIFPAHRHCLPASLLNKWPLNGIAMSGRTRLARVSSFKCRRHRPNSSAENVAPTYAKTESIIRRA